MELTSPPTGASVQLRVAVYVCVTLAALGLLREGVGSGALWIGVFVGFPVAFLLQGNTSPHVRKALHIASTALGFVVLAGLVSAVAANGAGGAAALQAPMASAFVWLLLCQAFDTKDRRGLILLLVASVVLVGVTGVLSISMRFVLPLAGWAIAFLVGLVLAHRCEAASLPHLEAVEASGHGAIRDVGRTFSVGAVALVIAAALFMIVPVAGTTRGLTFPSALRQRDAVALPGGLSNPSLGSADPSRSNGSPDGGGRASFGYFGFSTTLDTALRGRPDNSIVMRVRASSPDFWQAQTFDRWDGRTWSISNDHAEPLRGNDSIVVPRVDTDGPPFPNTGTDTLVQTYYLDSDGPNMIFAAAQPIRLYFPDRIVFQIPDGSVRAGVNLFNGAVYTVVSKRALATPASLRAAGDLGDTPEVVLRRYAEPPTTTRRVAELAATITRNAPTTYDKVQAIEAWMGKHTRYTLDVPPLPRGADAVDQFLFVDKRGFCEQISSSLVVMLRSLGIPARLAVGYATGERNPFTGLYEVRGSDAHAWAQVYFPGIGWQSFDPTASVPLAGDSSIDGAGSGALAYLDAHLDVPAWAIWACGAASVVGSALWLMRRHRIRRSQPGPTPSWAAEQLHELEALAAPRGYVRPASMTTPAYAACLAQLDPEHGEDLRRAGGILDAAMFSDSGVRQHERAAVEGLLRELRTAWRHVASDRELNSR